MNLITSLNHVKSNKTVPKAGVKNVAFLSKMFVIYLNIFNVTV